MLARALWKVYVCRVSDRRYLNIERQHFDIEDVPLHYCPAYGPDTVSSGLESLSMMVLRLWGQCKIVRTSLSYILLSLWW